MGVEFELYDLVATCQWGVVCEGWCHQVGECELWLSQGLDLRIQGLG